MVHSNTRRGFTQEVVNNNCHSRTPLSGISTTLAWQKADPRQKPSGMTTNGFTLIELLVVVLIIVILAAVAVPQYQKAVDKARYTELMSLVKNIKVQQEVYFLANGEYAANCKELALDIPTNTTLEDSGIIRENRGKFKIICSHGNNRAAGILLDEQKNNLLSYEMYFRHIEPDQDEIHRANRIACWGKDRFANVCKSLCVGEWNGTENAGFCTIRDL